jgi:hypothetical protein
VEYSGKRPVKSFFDAERNEEIRDKRLEIRAKQLRIDQLTHENAAATVMRLT